MQPRMTRLDPVSATRVPPDGAPRARAALVAEARSEGRGTAAPEKKRRPAALDGPPAFPRPLLLATLLAMLSLSGAACSGTPDRSKYDLNGGQHFAVITDGDITDFGWSAVVNQGRVEMEQRLNLSGTLFLPNVQGQPAALQTCDSLVARGYRVIIYASYAYGNGPYLCALRHPNVTFAQYGIKSNLTNLSDIVFSNIEIFFYIGAFCGATTTNGRVGMVFSDPSLSPINAMNGFYSGVKFANPDATVHMVFTGAAHDPDREAGAADLLLDQVGVGALTSTSGGLTVPIKAMNAGLLGIGVNGYSLRAVYGQLAGISFLHSFTRAFSAFAPALTSGAPMNSSFSGTFRSGDQTLDVPSYFVTQEQLAPMLQGIAQVKSGRSAYLCGPYMAALGPLSNATGCLNSTAQIDARLHPDIRLLGTYVVPLVDVPFPRSIAVAVVAAAGALLVLVAGLGVAVVALCGREEIRAGSPFFLCTMLLGCAVVFAGTIPWVLFPTPFLCRARVWLLSTGATLAVGSLVAKNLRLMLMHLYPMRWHSRQMTPWESVAEFVPGVAALLLADVLLLIAYSALGPRGVRVLQGVGGLGRYQTHHVCASSDSGDRVAYALLSFHALQLVAGSYVSFRCYRLIADEKFREHKAVGQRIYLVTVSAVIVGLVASLPGFGYDGFVTVLTVAVLCVNTGAVFVLLGPRFMDMFLPDQSLLFLRRFVGLSSAHSSSSGSVTRSPSERSGNSSAHASPPATPRGNPTSPCSIDVELDLGAKRVHLDPL